MKSFFLFWSVITISIVTQQITLTAISPFNQYDSQVFFSKILLLSKLQQTKYVFLDCEITCLSVCDFFLSIVHYMSVCPLWTCRIHVHVSENAFA